MKLSKRLQAIYELIDQDAIVGDIGCDHALLSCALVLNGKAQMVYACDVKEEPLLQAKKSIQYYNVEDKVQTILCDGFQKLPIEVDTVVIAGMGFETIKEILDYDENRLRSFSHIIIQSNRDVEKIRKYISDHHYHIIHEVCVYDTLYYQIIEFNCNPDQVLSKKEILFGKEMKKDNVYYQMWFANLKKYEAILDKVSKTNEKYNKIEEVIQQIREEVEI